MTRALRLLIHNWPLKLAAIGLAWLLYGGLVLSQGAASLAVVIPVAPIDQPSDTFVLNAIRPVTEIRYFAPSGVRPIASDFEASVDLSGVTAGEGPQSVPVQVRSIDARVTVTGFQPQDVTVDLDVVTRKFVDVRVERGDTPPNVEIGTTAAEPTRVEVIGPASVLSRVVAARADVIIQSSGINVDQDVELVAVDAVGNAVAQVRLEPSTTRVTIPVFTDRQSKTLPISPVITGAPAAGFELAAASVEPRFITVEGDINELTPLTTIETEPISVGGLSSSETIDATLALPIGVVALDEGPVQVSVTLRPVTATRSFEVGLRLIGAQTALIYAASVDRVLITVGGGVVDLDRLAGATLIVDLDVSGLGLGTSTVPVEAVLPSGVILVASNPTEVQVTITMAATSSPPAATSPSPGG